MTLESLNKRIKTTTDLKDIVGTMKMLSSVSIGPYEKALKSLDEYSQTIWDAFAGLMRDDSFVYVPERRLGKASKTIAVMIGTDNGLVGRFNRDMVTFVKKDLTDRGALTDSYVICVGKRIGLMADSAKMRLSATYAIMNSLKEVSAIASMVLMKINELTTRESIERVLVYYTRKRTGEPQHPTVVQLMPLPAQEMNRFKNQKWAGRTLPLITADRDRLFQALIHEHLIAVLGMALTASLAAEHYTRMVNMQQAEKNIDESLEEMNLSYQQLRQTGITDELIDIVSGAESLKKKK